jgi:hypothetical protein
MIIRTPYTLSPHRTFPFLISFNPSPSIRIVASSVPSLRTSMIISFPGFLLRAGEPTGLA